MSPAWGAPRGSVPAGRARDCQGPPPLHATSRVLGFVLKNGDVDLAGGRRKRRTGRGAARALTQTSAPRAVPHSVPSPPGGLLVRRPRGAEEGGRRRSGAAAAAEQGLE